MYLQRKILGEGKTGKRGWAERLNKLDGLAESHVELRVDGQKTMKSKTKLNGKACGSTRHAVW
jgi:hypothetical protein